MTTLKKASQYVPKETLVALKSAHGDLFPILVPEDIEDEDGNMPEPDVFVLRRPSIAEVDRLTDELFDDSKKSRAVQKLAKAMIVWPPKDELAKIVERRPAILLALGKPAQTLAGLVDELALKKA